MLSSMATIPTTEPIALRAGDTWQWRREDLSSDYPASAWTLKYYFRNAAAYFDVTATADGDNFAVDVAKATTASRTVGYYDWVAVVESASERHEIDAGRLQVLPDLSASSAYDARSFARKMLDYIEAELVSRGSSGQLDLINAQLEQRSISRDKAGLITLRAQFLTEVRRETSAQQGIKRNKLLVRFNNG